MSMTNPTFRALCAELADELQGYKVAHPMHCRALLNRARAALAQPEPVAPTDREIFAEATKFLYFSFAYMGDPNKWDGTDADLLAFARAVLALRVTPANIINQEDYDRG